MKSFISIVALGALLTACTSVHGPMGSMSAGIGPVKDCGQFKFSDPSCNPALNAGGGSQ